MRVNASRRNWVAGAGLFAISGLVWWQWPKGSKAEQALWDLEAKTLDGEPMRMARFRGQRLVVNFWATWCAPCVEEMPLLSRFQNEHATQGWQVLGLAIDQPAAVGKFLQRVPVTFTIGIVGPSGLELMQKLGNERGGLPFTVLLDRQGAVAQRKIGQLSSSDLKTWLLE